jgi:hypothetical protein
MYINNQYLRRGGIDVNSLFAKADVTEMVDKICPHIKNDLKQMLKVATDENFILQSGESAPEDGVGKFCENPFNCPLKPVCWKNVDKNSIYSLYSVTQKVINRLVLQNIKLICEIPDDFEGMNLKQKIQISCVKNSKPHIDRNAIAEFISKVSFPVCFLDFETFASPVPLIDLTKPYQGIPFQFSLHVLEDPDGYPRHLSFLASGNSDPRAQLLKSLKENFLSVKPDEDRFDGSIIVYNESFERSILRDLAVFDPSYADWIYMISSKIVDLYEPFRNFNYYNKLQNGSASVKKVLPALTDKSYENLEISNGDAANISFLEKSDLWDRFIKEYKLKDKFKAVYNNYSGTEGNEDEEKIIEKLRQDLHNYCKLDTEGMVDIYRELVSIAGKF